MFKRVLVLCVAVIAATGLGASAQQGPKGTEKRPFYIIGHNPNTIDDATLAVENGANVVDATSPLGVTTTFAPDAWTPPVTRRRAV